MPRWASSRAVANVAALADDTNDWSDPAETPVDCPVYVVPLNEPFKPMHMDWAMAGVFCPVKPDIAEIHDGTRPLKVMVPDTIPDPTVPDVTPFTVTDPIQPCTA